MGNVNPRKFCAGLKAAQRLQSRGPLCDCRVADYRGGNAGVSVLRDTQPGLDNNPAENLEAYNLYQRGRFSADRRWEKRMRKTLPLFQQAVETGSPFAVLMRTVEFTEP